MTRPIRRGRPQGLLAHVADVAADLEEDLEIEEAETRHTGRGTLVAETAGDEVAELRACLSEVMSSAARLEAENARLSADLGEARRIAAIREREAAERAADLATVLEERAAAVRETGAAVADMAEILDTARAEAAALAADLDAAREALTQRDGEIEALRARVRDEIGRRADAVQQVERLERDMAELAGDVLSADVDRQRRGLFRRPPKAPPARPSASRTPRPGDQPAAATAGPVAEEDLDSVLERRLFGK